jgi:hypothetical protein
MTTEMQGDGDAWGAALLGGLAGVVIGATATEKAAYERGYDDGMNAWYAEGLHKGKEEGYALGSQHVGAEMEAMRRDYERRIEAMQTHHRRQLQKRDQVIANQAKALANQRLIWTEPFPPLDPPTN